MNGYVFIKIRGPGDKRFGFLGQGGTVQRLRIYASMFPSLDLAQALIDENTPDNPGWEWKIVPVSHNRSISK